MLGSGSVCCGRETGGREEVCGGEMREGTVRKRNGGVEEEGGNTVLLVLK